MLNIFDWSCVRVTAQKQNDRPSVSWVGVMNIAPRWELNNHPYIFADVDGEFECIFPGGVKKYVDAIKFRIADIIPFCPISRGLVCSDVQVVQDDVHTKVGWLLLHSSIEAGLIQEEEDRYRGIIIKRERFRLSRHEELFVDNIRERAKLYLQHFKENLLYKRNYEYGTAGVIELF